MKELRAGVARVRAYLLGSSLRAPFRDGRLFNDKRAALPGMESADEVVGAGVVVLDLGRGGAAAGDRIAAHVVPVADLLALPANQISWVFWPPLVSWTRYSCPAWTPTVSRPEEVIADAKSNRGKVLALACPLCTLVMGAIAWVVAGTHARQTERPDADGSKA